MMVNIVDWKGTIIGVDLPNTVELKVVETDAGFKGDTATGTTKSAKLETGYTVNVPLFVNNGDLLKIDTRSGDYLGRA
jgi:elongation factor P